MIFDSIFCDIKNKRILRGVYLKVDPGKICGLFGPNGSGKTTLIKIGAGMILPTSGTVFVSGQAFIKKSIRSRYSQLAYLPQETFLPKDMRIGKLLHSFPKKSADLINETKLANLADQKIRSLSSGELRLLELILIISLQRPFLLLDEPFTGIAPVVIETMIELLKKERDNGKGILVTDHYYRYISQIADRAYHMKDGRCELIDSDASLEDELKTRGYLKKK